MNIPLIINIVAFVALLIALNRVGNQSWSLSKRVLTGLVLGSLAGTAGHLWRNSPVVKESIGWFNIVGNGYVQLLQMIVMPLVFASILSAVARLHNASSLGKISVLTIGVLLFTTAISALVGVLVTGLFHLSAEGLVQGAQETARLSAIQSNYVGKVADLSTPQLLLSFIPKNPFADLAGANPTSIISVVIFAAFLGVAALQLLKDDKAKGERVLVAIDTLQSGDEAGPSDHEADAVRRAGADDQSGCRFQPAGHHQAGRLCGGLVSRPRDHVWRSRAAAVNQRHQPAALLP